MKESCTFDKKKISIMLSFKSLTTFKQKTFFA